MTNIRRYEASGRPVFITAVCHRRKPYLKTDWQKELLLAVMREVKLSSGFSMHAYVLLNDHFHWLITPNDLEFPKVMQSRKLRYVHRFKNVTGKEEKTTLWQRRFWDHIICNDHDLHKHMDYIHYNPVKHGVVSKPMDYRWSSFNTHVQLGNYASHWGAYTPPVTIGSLRLE